jgi:hypothetical protein
MRFIQFHAATADWVRFSISIRSQSGCPKTALRRPTMADQWRSQGTGSRTSRGQFRTGTRDTIFSRMSDGISREETRSIIDDKLEAVEARADVKYAEMNGKLDLLVDRLGRVASDVSSNTSEIRSDYKNMRLTIVVTAIASVLAIIGVLLTSQANMYSAFQTGISTGEHSLPPVKDVLPSHQSPPGTGSGTQP